jgi:hypothetical protein
VDSGVWICGRGLDHLRFLTTALVTGVGRPTV